MLRANRLALLVAAFALAGCMRIYSDSELPDVEVEWFDADCREGTGDIALSLFGIDDPAFREDLVAPCSDTKAVFVDVPRERFRLEASLLTTTGEEFSAYDQELDLRNGLDERISLYLGGFGNARVAWVFDMDASCASLAVDAFIIEVSSNGAPEPILYGTLCTRTPMIFSLPGGTHSIALRALSQNATVAVSPASPEIVVSSETFADFGTLVLGPCGSSCP